VAAALADTRVSDPEATPGTIAGVTVGPDSLRLDDRVAVVTGAAQGIGEAIAVTFARLGARLALCDRQAERLDETAASCGAEGADVLTGVFDVREPEPVEAFFADVARTFGRVDVLVNNAGGGFAAPFIDVSPKGEAALIRENFTSVTACIRRAVPLMPDGGGSIITITSIEAHRAAPGFATYSAMKAAVANLTKSLALELGERRIRVNCIAPDVIPTPGLGPMEVRTPLPVAGEADDVAAAAAFLAGDLARFVTGTTLHVDGGNHAAGGWRRGPDGRFEL
jgi:NAD(P)-dependent dehydrogenase (short-subunit alcohol dehydrogenase family)